MGARGRGLHLKNDVVISTLTYKKGRQERFVGGFEFLSSPTDFGLLNTIILPTYWNYRGDPKKMRYGGHHKRQKVRLES